MRREAGSQLQSPYPSHLLLQGVSTLQPNSVHRSDQSMEIPSSWASEEEGGMGKGTLNINN